MTLLRNLSDCLLQILKVYNKDEKFTFVLATKSEVSVITEKTRLSRVLFQADHNCVIS